MGEKCLLQSITKMLSMFHGNCPIIQTISSEGKISVKGNGWKHPKFHAHLHLPQWISDFGLPANFNTQQFESNHKVIVKNVSHNVQKHGCGKFLSQMANRGYERQLLSITMEKLDIKPITKEPYIHLNHGNNTNNNNKWRTKKSTQFELTITPYGMVKQHWINSKNIGSHLEIHPCICNYISERYKHSSQIVKLGCVTELLLDNNKVIWCHPNFQGEGEWGDWVLHGCANSRKLTNGQWHVFQPDCHKRECPSRVVLMIVSIDNILLTTPVMILRNCNKQTELSVNFDSVLLTRFAKSYNTDGTPSFIQLPIDRILDRVFVVKDFLELFEHKLDRYNLIMDGPSLPVEWYNDSYNSKSTNLKNTPANTVAKRNKFSKIMENENLIEDWAYIVLPYQQWAESFSN